MSSGYPGLQTNINILCRGIIFHHFELQMFPIKMSYIKQKSQTRWSGVLL